ncbi:thioredoxin domain-containing protein 6 [Quaeritorhiza haematococci]|nr:thioredoxin domain-containing protein 6 [Quaeritorhiza haematococci]
MGVQAGQAQGQAGEGQQQEQKATPEGANAEGGAAPSEAKPEGAPTGEGAAAGASTEAKPEGEQQQAQEGQLPAPSDPAQQAPATGEGAPPTTDSAPAASPAPVVVNRKDEIVAKMVQAGFTVVKEAEVTMSVEQAKEFYREHEGKTFFEELVSVMTSGPVYALVLEKDSAINALMQMMGPASPAKAKEMAPESLRALYGTTDTDNGVHGSDTPAAAEREIRILFGESVSPFVDPVIVVPDVVGAPAWAPQPQSQAEQPQQPDQQPAAEASTASAPSPSQPAPPAPAPALERTLALIKPDAYGSGKKDEIIQRIRSEGFVVVKEGEVKMTEEMAREFYAEHEGKGFFAELVGWMSSAPIYAIVLEKEGGIGAWRELAGPTNSEKARESAPNSIRALYGTDGSHNAVHGSDSPASAAREIKVVFGGEVDPNPTPAAPAPATEQQQQPAADNPTPPPALERTLALIKPDVYQPAQPPADGATEQQSDVKSKKDEIMERIKEGGFTVVKEGEVVMTQEMAKEFYGEHEGKGFFEELVGWMSSAPIYAMVLEKEGAIKAWRELAGPTNSEKAREVAPTSIRALYGTDGSHNAVHGSDSPTSAAREIKIIFGDSVSPIAPAPAPAPSAPVEPTPASATDSAPAPAEQPSRERTLALIKPDAYGSGKKDEILNRIKGDGFTIVKESEVQFTEDMAKEFYKEHGGKGFFAELVGWMSSAPIYAMVLEKEWGVRAWRELAGPTNSERARESAPNSIRALFGTDGSHNAVHGSDSSASAAREIKVVFGDEVEPLPATTPASPVPVSEPSQPQPETVTEAAAADVQPSTDAAPAPTAPTKTLALIKPDAYGSGKKDEILGRIRGESFMILKEAEVLMTQDQAREFYREHEGKEFFETLVGWMSSAPIYAMVLEREDAVAKWRELAGPTNSEKARETAPNSIRALFGTDGSHNAVHGSDSPTSAAREIKVIFGDEEEVPSTTPAPAPVTAAPESQSQQPNADAAPASAASIVERTLALMKPDAYGSGKKEDILGRIREAGFTIAAEKEMQMTVQQAEEFYKEHEGKGFYETLTKWMSSAPIYAMVLEKEGAIKAWRELAGPTNSEKAREIAPNSIRALFGTDGSQNAVHGSDSPASAIREIRILFDESMAVMPGDATSSSTTTAPTTQAAETDAAPSTDPQRPPSLSRTLALIKPDAHGAGKKDEILQRIRDAGLAVVAEKELQFGVEKAKEFYAEHEGKGFFEDLVNWMSSAPIYSMVLEGNDAVTAWRTLAGPTNSEKAREVAPNSLRALFGTDGSHNAVHGSDSGKSAAREIKIVFGDDVSPLPPQTEGQEQSQVPDDAAAAPRPPSLPPSNPASRPESPNKSRRVSNPTPPTDRPASTSPSKRGSRVASRRNSEPQGQTGDQTGVAADAASVPEDATATATKSPSKPASRTTSRSPSKTASRTASRSPSKTASRAASSSRLPATSSSRPGSQGNSRPLSKSPSKTASRAASVKQGLGGEQGPVVGVPAAEVGNQGEGGAAP